MTPICTAIRLIEGHPRARYWATWTIDDETYGAEVRPVLDAHLLTFEPTGETTLDLVDTIQAGETSMPADLLDSAGKFARDLLRSAGVNMPRDAAQLEEHLRRLVDRSPE